MSLLWLRVAVFLYGIAALAVLPAALYDRPRWRHIAIPATVAAVFFHFVSLAEMLNEAHQGLSPVFEIATHETRTFLSLLLAVAFLLVYSRYKTVSVGVFLLPICFLLCLIPAFRPGLETASFPFSTAAGFCSTSSSSSPPTPHFFSAFWPRSSTSFKSDVSSRSIPPSPGFLRLKPPTRSPSSRFSSDSPA